MATRFSRVLLASTALMPLAAAMVQANPLDGVVQAGQATITATPGLTTVTQTSTHAIINWQAFDIDVGEATVFVQPGTDSVVLNRVTGDLGPSTILGTITSNGFVFVVNPDGILFGAGAIVDTGGFLGTTAGIANGDFMAGRYSFNVPGNPQASIVNEGMITAAEGGFAALVAPGVRNSGIITARLGNVALAAGTGFTLDFYGDGLITLAVGDEIPGGVIDLATGQPMAALVDNAGTLAADGGTVAMTAATARQVVDAVINNTGVVEANTVGTRNGRIVLGAATAATTTSAAPQQRVAVGGRLSAAGTENGETGGRVIITGEAIITNDAAITAAGAAGGGAVLIGGDVAGGVGTTLVPLLTSSRPELQPIPTATDVWIDVGTTIDASAMYGDAGKVVVWADGTTSLNGEISAHSAAVGGYGGFVEVSGLQSLTFNGYVNAGSPLGTAGTLLLDPLDVVIGAGGLSAAAIQGALDTNNVVVTTGTTGTDAGDITVAETVSWGTGFSLTLEAYRNIVINDAVVIANTADGDLNLRADAAGTGIGTVTFLGVSRVAYGGSTGLISVFYNPTDYTTPTDYAPFVVTNSSVDNQFTAYMLVNDIYDLQNINQHMGGAYALGRDIDATETATWNGGAGFVPIGETTDWFYGKLEGLGHTIAGLYINRPLQDYVGLFGVSSATLANISLVDANVTGRSLVGGLVGWAFGGTIAHSMSSGSVVGTSAVGGLIGSNNSELSYSHSTANVWGNTSIGGLVGANDGGFVYRSFATGLVQGGGALGGLVGYNRSTISESYATGNVNNLYPNFVSVGGLVGVNYYDSKIVNSYSTGSATGFQYVGGLVGSNLGTVEYSYSSGNATGSFFSDTGALVGGNYVFTGDPNVPTILNSFSISIVVSPTPPEHELIGYFQTGVVTQSALLSAADLQGLIPTGFDTAVWGTSTEVNAGYPHLLWQEQVTPAPAETIFEPPFAVDPPSSVPDPSSSMPPVSSEPDPSSSLPPSSDPDSSSEPPPPPMLPSPSIVGGNPGYPLLGPGAPVWGSSAPEPLLVVSGGQTQLANTSIWTGLAGPASVQEVLSSLQPILLRAQDAYTVDPFYADPANGDAGWREVAKYWLGMSDAEINAAAASGFQAAVFIDGNRTIIAFAGTDPTELADLRTDALNALGYQTDQYDFAIQFTRLLLADMTTHPERYGPDIVLTGHSLGGGLAAHVGTDLGVAAVTINAAPIIGAPPAEFRTEYVLNLRLEGELASEYGSPVAVTTIPGHTILFTDELLARYGLVQQGVQIAVAQTTLPIVAVGQDITERYYLHLMGTVLETVDRAISDVSATFSGPLYSSTMTFEVVTQ